MATLPLFPSANLPDLRGAAVRALGGSAAPAAGTGEYDFAPPPPARRYNLRAETLKMARMLQTARMEPTTRRQTWTVFESPWD